MLTKGELNLNNLYKKTVAFLLCCILFSTVYINILASAEAGVAENHHILDFESYPETVYLHKSSAETYPDNYISYTRANARLAPVTNICKNMFTNGTLAIEQAEDASYGKVLTMKRLGETLYKDNGYFMIPANYKDGNASGVKSGKLVLEFDLNYMHNWKFGLYITPVSDGKNDGGCTTLIKENSYIGSVNIGSAVSEKWIHVKLTYNLDTMTYSGSVGDYSIVETDFTLNESDPNLGYYKIDVTMSGAGRYASFDNFATSYIPGNDDDEEEVVADSDFETYLNSSGRRGIYPFFYASGETAQWQALPGETKPRMHLARKAGTTSDRTPYLEFEVYNIESDIQSYVYEIDVYPAEFTNNSSYFVSLFNVYDATDTTLNHSLLKVGDDSILYGDKLISTLAQNKWTRVSCVVDLTDNTYSVYTDGVLKASKLSVPYTIIPRRIRIAITWGNTNAEYYFDNIRLYEGSVMRDNPETYVSSKEDESDVSNIIGNSSVFMTDADGVYTGGVKTTYSAKGYSKFIKNGKFYLCSDGAKHAIGCDDNTLSPYIVQNNGKSYVPLTDTALALGKYVYEDSRGWVCVSDKNLGLSNSDSSGHANEDSDIVDRYMHFTRTDGDELYNMLMEHSGGTHPRIFASPEDVLALKNDIATNEFKKTGAGEVIRQANEILRKGLTAYEKEDGLRLFIPCLTVRNNLITLTTAYMITDDTAKKQLYFERIWQEIDNVCNVWKDWNVERHYLDSGKLAVGIALAYDVCYNELGAEKRAIIRDAVLEKLWYYTFASYAGGTQNYNIGKSTVNWGAVCNGGSLLLCLATMDDPDASSEYREYCKFIAAEALQGLEYPIGCTFPDGAWVEGLSYYGYIVEYLSWSANALVNACGTDFGIMAYPGVAEMPRYALYIQSVANGFFNYSDGSGDANTSYVPSECFLMARLIGDRKLNDILYNFKFKHLGLDIYNSQFIRDFLFYTPGTDSDAYSAYPLDSRFGNIEVSVMKGGWTGDDAYVASIGGILDVNSHFDRGSFVFDILGERWAIDLGKDDYNIAGGYYGELGYTLYRKRAEGHNTLVFNPDEGPGQVPYATAYIEDCAYGEDEAYTIYNLSDVYAEDCTEARRGFFLGDGRKTLVIQDEFTLNNDSGEVYWFMHTRADIQKIDDDTVTLTQNGKTVRLDFMTSLNNFNLSAMEAQPLPTTPERDGQASNDGIKKVCFKASGSGEGYITVKITPVTPGGEYTDISYIPMSRWSVVEYHAEITDVSASFDGKRISASFDVRSLSGKEYTAMAVFYNADNKLISVITEDMDGQYKTSSKVFECDVTRDDAAKVKFMLWDDTIHPLTTSEFIELK